MDLGSVSACQGQQRIGWRRSCLHRWVTEHLRSVRFCRYADDGVIHCKSQTQAEYVLRRLVARFGECGLELHPDKTRIVYCRDINRPDDHPVIQFTFLGYTFRPRKAVDKHGRVYVNFAPAASRDTLLAMLQTIRGWHLQLQCDRQLGDLSRRFNLPWSTQPYLHTEEGWLYLAVVIDLYSRMVIGWAMGERMTADLVCDALRMALWRRKQPKSVIVHTDRGSQYCSLLTRS